VRFGGKTVRCHPDGGRTPAPDGLYYDHTMSHWQSISTYLRYIEESIVPYHQATVQRLKLPADQKCVLIHDLHFSHQGADVVDFCNANNILLVYVPAGCTDIMQMCDKVLNKPYKNAITKAFIEYVNGKFEEHTASGDDGLFSLNMALSVMKPVLPIFVQTAMEALSTTAMKDVIRECFLEDGLVRRARTLDALVAARVLLAADNEPVVGEELQPDLDPLTTTMRSMAIKNFLWNLLLMLLMMTQFPRPRLLMNQFTLPRLLMLLMMNQFPLLVLLLELVLPLTLLTMFT